MIKARVYIFVNQFEGMPKSSDLRIIEEELPPLEEGEFLAEAVYLSVDPYMRARAAQLPLGQTFIGSQVAKIIESKHPNYSVGEYVVGATFGWRTHTITDAKEEKDEIGRINLWKLPELNALPRSLALGVLGMPGNTAYFGLLELCKPKAGETIAVSGAAGAVGSLVGQIAKIKGCKVIAIAGSDEKGKWLTEELNFDHFINYNDGDFEKKLEETSPDGIDCYFDNVGGQISTQILNRMNLFGRVAVCGSISGYNDQKNARADGVQRAMVSKQLKMEGFIVHRWADRWMEGILQNLKWIDEGKLKYRETVTEGFDNMLQAFIDMLEGKNFGKAIVKV